MLIWHDISDGDFAPVAKVLGTDGVTVIGPSPTIKSCVGCAGCWIKTPGACVQKDGFQNLGALLGSHSELVLISRCTYGCFSPFVRTLFERSIPALLPFFAYDGKKSRHTSRYARAFAYTALFYGDAGPDEPATATRLVHANAANNSAAVRAVDFYPSIQALAQALEARL